LDFVSREVDEIDGAAQFRGLQSCYLRDREKCRSEMQGISKSGASPRSKHKGLAVGQRFARRANVRNGWKPDIRSTRLFDRAVVKRLRDSNTIDQTELVPNERLGSLVRAVCSSTSHPRRSENVCNGWKAGAPLH
jgi:hypothetical protein